MLRGQGVGRGDGLYKHTYLLFWPARLSSSRLSSLCRAASSNFIIGVNKIDGAFRSFEPSLE